MLKLKVTVKQQTGKDYHIMKILIASDIHGSAYYCRLLLERYREEKADKLLLLGDILYHGPRNDLPRDYAPKEVLAMLNEIKEELRHRGGSDGAGISHSCRVLYSV